MGNSYNNVQTVGYIGYPWCTNYCQYLGNVSSKYYRQADASELLKHNFEYIYSTELHASSDAIFNFTMLCYPYQTDVCVMHIVKNVSS